MSDEKLRHLPATYTIVCEMDPFKDQNLIFAHRLEKVGVKSQIAYYELCMHGSVTQIGIYSGYRLSEKIQDDLISFIRVNFYK